MACAVLISGVVRQSGVLPIAAGCCGFLQILNTMRCLTNSEIHKWLAGQGMHHQPLENGVPVAGDFPLPTEQRSRLMLADYLVDLLGKDGNKLLEILPSPQDEAEDWEILSNFRAGLNETRPLVATPGHLFKSGDKEHFRSLLTQLLGAGQRWSFYIYSAPSHTSLLIGDRVEVWTPKKGVRNELGRYLMPSQAA